MNSPSQNPGEFVMHMKKQEEKRKGISGLEMAILVIAFVVAAALIIYSAVSAGVI